MSQHSGHEKHSPEGKNSGNSSNGYAHKTIRTDNSEIEIQQQQDREKKNLTNYEGENMRQDAKKIIKELIDNNYYIVCPCCSEPVKAKDAGLFFLDDFSKEGRQTHDQMVQDIKDREAELRETAASISVRSQNTAKAVNIGFISEHIAPTLKDFMFEPGDCRSLFDPIDYVIFEGLSKKGRVDRIIFTDIKTGNAKLKSNQKVIKELVEKKKVKFDMYRRPGK